MLPRYPKVSRSVVICEHQIFKGVLTNPLLRVRQVGILGEREPVLRVVMSVMSVYIQNKFDCFHIPREVAENCRTLLDAQSALVVVYKHRDTTIGSQFGEPRLFLNILHDVDGLEDVVGTVRFLDLL